MLFWTKAGRFCPWKATNRSYSSRLLRSLTPLLAHSQSHYVLLLRETMAMVLSLRFDRRHGQSIETSMLTSNGRHGTMASIHHYFARKQVGDTQKARGNPRCAVPAEIHSICSDRRDLSSAAGLQVSPTSDTCESVAILMNRRHFLFVSRTKVICV